MLLIVGHQHLELLLVELDFVVLLIGVDLFQNLVLGLFHKEHVAHGGAGAVDIKIGGLQILLPQGEALDDVVARAAQRQVILALFQRKGRLQKCGVKADGLVDDIPLRLAHHAGVFTVFGHQLVKVGAFVKLRHQRGGLVARRFDSIGVQRLPLVVNGLDEDVLDTDKIVLRRRPDVLVGAALFSRHAGGQLVNSLIGIEVFLEEVHAHAGVGNGLLKGLLAAVGRNVAVNLALHCRIVLFGQLQAALLKQHVDDGLRRRQIQRIVDHFLEVGPAFLVHLLVAEGGKGRLALIFKARDQAGIIVIKLLRGHNGVAQRGNGVLKGRSRAGRQREGHDQGHCCGKHLFYFFHFVPPFGAAGKPFRAGGFPASPVFCSWLLLLYSKIKAMSRRRSRGIGAVFPSPAPRFPAFP